MPSTVTSPVHSRIPNDQIPALRRLASRFGLTPSAAIAALVDAVLSGDESLRGAQTSRTETHRVSS